MRNRGQDEERNKGDAKKGEGKATRERRSYMISRRCQKTEKPRAVALWSVRSSPNRNFARTRVTSSSDPDDHPCFRFGLS